MASGNSKPRVNLEDLDSPIYEEMKKKYEETIVDVVPEWIENHGFPKRGTFRVSTLNRVKDSLEKHECRVRSKGKLKNKHKDKFQMHKRVMSLWLEEAEQRERKRVFKEMPFKEEKGTDDTSQNFSLYLFRKPQCAKVYHNVDSWPHQPPPSYSPPAMLPLDQDQTQELGHPSQETATPSAVSASLSTPLKITMHSQKIPTVERGTETTHKRQHMTTESMTKEEQMIEPDDLDEEGPRDGEVQTAGPKGPIMVFCPWSLKDLKEAMTHLPHPKDSGDKFAADLLVFCKEFSPTMQALKRLLMLKLGAKDWQKVRPHFPVNNAARIHVEWAHDDNRPYRNAVELLCQRVKTAFPVRVDIAKINSCIQGKDELVMDYYVRLYETF